MSQLVVAKPLGSLHKVWLRNLQEVDQQVITSFSLERDAFVPVYLARVNAKLSLVTANFYRARERLELSQWAVGNFPNRFTDILGSDFVTFRL